MIKPFKNLFAILIIALLLAGCGEEENCKGDKIANCVCDASYVPVCGCDNVTYSNACVAKCEGAKSFNNGPCSTAQNTSVIGDWDFMGYASTDALDLINPLKTHIYDVNLNFDDEPAGNGFFKVSGKSAVNFFSASYAVTGDEIKLKDFFVTEIAGTLEANQFENLYLKWLSGELTYAILNKNVLHINAKFNGNSDILVFKKK